VKKIITSDKPGIWASLKRVIAYKRLIYTFAQRDLKIQYAQTLLGILWAVLRPLIGLLIYTLFFSYLLNVNTGTIPYPLFAFSGMVCWYFFSFLVSNSGTALRESQYMIKKIYFPKLILPFSKVLVGLIEFSIAFAILLCLMAAWGVFPGIMIILLPLVVVLNIVAGLSIGIWLSALTIRYRDFHHVIPYLVNFGIFLTPIFYPATLIPEKYYYIVYLNPMAGVVESMRWLLFSGSAPSVNFLWGFIPVFLLFFSGIYYFTKIENKIADIV